MRLAKKTVAKKKAAPKAKKAGLSGLIGKYVLVRGTQCGVHAGVLASEDGEQMYLSDSRRIWYWDGAASLSEIAVYGTAPAKRGNCRFAAKVDLIRLYHRDVCEVILCRPAGRECIETMPEWRA